jgi:phosphoserine phosphatase RsbU/P
MTTPLDVIIAEDNIVQRTYLSRMIEQLGYNAITAENGQEALDLICASGAQILITDYHMPYLNGIELTRAVRDLGSDHYVHIIMMTGSAHDEIGSEALEAGADEFLTKGHDPARLKARLKTAARLIHHSHELAEQHRVLKEANDRIRKDLAAAAHAQRQLLPDIHKDLLGFHIASAFIPSAVVSGDMFGCFCLPHNKIGAYVVDVSGHGISASLLSVAIGHLITPEFFANVAFDADGAPNPAGLIHNLNRRFYSVESDEYFTMFCVIIDKNSGQMDLCQAGYPSPIYISPNGSSKFIGDGGFAVGMFRNATYQNGRETFEEGGLLVICSDAASEAENLQGKPLGNYSLQDLVKQSAGVEADNLPDRLVAALTDWRGGKALEDDLTILTLKRSERNDPLHQA